MKILLMAAVALASFAAIAASGERVTSLDGEWQFARDGGAFAAVEVPHDWAIAGPFDRGGSSATGKLPWKGAGIYRRTFTASVPKDGGAVRLEFDGVMARPEVFVNGIRVGGWDYGYMGFSCDISGAVRDGENELEVRASTLEHGSRWYPGGGIYRSVRLVECARGYTLPGTVFITTPDVTRDAATVHVEWRTADGRHEKSFVVSNPVLWSPETPQLYEVEVNGRTYRYGVRTCRFTPDDGFHLNGRRYQLKGANLHADLGPLGMAFHKGAARRQLEIMKDMGVNAIRTAHNPPDPQFLDLCDEMGFLVWDECFDKWNDTASRRADENLEEYVTRNLRAFVRRDRNHPSVICWSISNEIAPAGDKNLDGQTRARVAAFAAAVRALDPTRPVGSGNCHPEWFRDRTVFDALDVTGWNYSHSYAEVHGWGPQPRAVVMTESAAAVSSAGWLGDAPPANKYDFATNVTEVSGFDGNAVPYGDIPDIEFERIARDGFCAGEFVWTGFDYLGEPSPYDYVIKGLEPARQSRSSYFGCVDLAGFPKNRFWLYRSHWNRKDHTVHIVANLGGNGGRAAWVYTDGEEAELFADGRSLGRRRKTAADDYALDFMRVWPRRETCEENPYYAICDKYRLRWFEVPAGTKELVAVAFKDGAEIGRAVKRAAGRPVRIESKLERERDGLLFFNIALVDAIGTVVEDASESVSFSVKGPGRIIAFGNGDARGYASFKATDSHPLYCGRALVIVRREGSSAIDIVAE